MKLKHCIKIILIGILCFLPVTIEAKEKVTLYFFHGNTCVHCKAAWEYLNEITPNYPELEIVGYEVFEDSSNAALLEQVRKVLGSDSRGVPFFVVGERYLTGFNELRKEDLKTIMEYYLKHPDEYTDVVSKVVAGELPNDEENKVVEEVHPVNMNQQRKEKMLEKILLYSALAIGLIGILIGLKKKW